jgi:hypothetical protein
MNQPSPAHKVGLCCVLQSKKATLRELK